MTMESETTTVSGLVIPTAWDEDGTVLGVAIFDREERQHVIHQDDEGRQLLGLIHEDVEVQATVVGKCKGSIVLKVQNFWLKTDDNGRKAFQQKGPE